MKKTTIPAGGHQIFYDDDIHHLSESTVEAASALAGMHGQNYYLSDPLLTDGSSGGFLTKTCVAGWLVYNGEPCSFDAQTATASTASPTGGMGFAWVPFEDHRACDPLSYADGTSKSPHIIKKVQLQWVDPASSPPDEYEMVDQFSYVKDIIRGYFAHSWTEVQAAGAGSAPAFFSSREAVDDIPMFTPAYGDLVSDKVYYRRRDYVGKFECKGTVKVTGTTALGGSAVSLFSIKDEDVVSDNSIGGIVSCFFGDSNAVQFAHVRLKGNIVQAMIPDIPGTGETTYPIYIMLDGLSLNYAI